MDERLRRLEREAARGDPLVKAALLRARERAGQSKYGWSFVPEQGFSRSYGSGLTALRSEAAKEAISGLHPAIDGIARPLTFKETIQARVEQFRRNGGRSANDLFSLPIDTCTAIVYRANNIKFKIIFQSDALINIDEDFDREFVNVTDYNSITGDGVVELSVNDSIYNGRLSRSQVLAHQGWLAALEGDRDLLQEYVDIVFKEPKHRAMEFSTLYTQVGRRWMGYSSTQLRQLCVSDLGRSECIATKNVDDAARFARIVSIAKDS